ncbi:MAG: ATP-dependent DNA helicase [Candidatus Vogelbacteria bacterium]
MTSASFNKLYKQLNPAQREAVDTIDGPVMVVAGPGTGKTQVLTLRIANILRLTDTSPDSILALTFTNSGVHSMRERLVEIIGSRAYRVTIHTFHGFCNELINRYPEHFPSIVGARPANQVDQLKIMEKVIDQSRLAFLKPWNDPYHYLTSVLQAIERLKKENLSPRDFVLIVNRMIAEFEALPDLRHEKGVHAGKIRGKYHSKQTQLFKNRELGILYRRYETALKEKKLYDFSDMVMEVIRVVEQDEDFRLMLQEEYQYLLADEHQDANQSQNRLLELLASFHESPNIFIVGDDKQAIFQFQGASLDNFNYFRRLYPRARLVTLIDNYRSTQAILDAARSVILTSQSIPEDSRVKLLARSRQEKPAKSQGKIRIYPASDSTGELNFLIKELQARIKQGTPPTELAILYRDNRDATAIIEELERADLPYQVATSSDVLTDLDIQKLITLFKAIHYFGDDQYLITIFHFDFFGFEALDLYRLSEEARTKRMNLYWLIRDLKSLKRLGLKQPAMIHRLYQSLERWQKMSRNQNLLELFGAVINESSFLETLLKHPQAVEKLSRLHSFFDELKLLVTAEPQYSLAQWLDHLTTLTTHGATLGKPTSIGLDGIQVSTVHRAKGLEWDYVYLVKTYDGHFGNRRRHTDFLLPTRGINFSLVINDQEEDERRLFYVALTRARRGVTISYSERGDNDRRQLPSQFIEEIDKKLIENLPVDKTEIPPADFSLRPPRGLGLRHREYLRRLFHQQGLSATGLNNYLRCPLRYYFQNLLRLVKVKDKRLIYGTAMHGALFDFFEALRAGNKISKKLLLKSFQTHLAREPLTAIDQELVRKRGTKALTGYYNHYRKTFVKPLVNELSIRGVLLDPVSRSTTRLRLTGQLDKIEPLDATTVRVVDYKTGRPRKTDDYWRQLVFYKLLLDRWDNGKYKMVEGELDFLEPNASGKYCREIFAVTYEDTKALVVTIRQVADEILSLKFLDHGCHKPDCQFCTLWAMSQKN